MAIDQVIGMLLRQAGAQGLESTAAIAGAVDDQRAVHRHPFFVLHRGHEPSRVGVLRVHGDRKAEAGHRRLHLLPTGGVVGAAPDAAMVLAPQHFGLRRAAHDAVRVLHVGVAGLFRRHEIGAHAFGLHLPVGAVVVRDPGAAAAQTDQHLLRVLRVRAYRMDAGFRVAAAEPFGTFRALPQRVDELPTGAEIGAAKQATGNRAGPHGASA